METVTIELTEAVRRDLDAVREQWARETEAAEANGKVMFVPSATIRNRTLVSDQQIANIAVGVAGSTVRAAMERNAANIAPDTSIRTVETDGAGLELREHSIVTESDDGAVMHSLKTRQRDGTRGAIKAFCEALPECVGSWCEVTRDDGATVYEGELAVDSVCGHTIDGVSVASRVAEHAL